MSTNRFPDFQKLVEELESDFEKFYDKGISSAGTRVRKQLQTLTALAKEVRKEVTEIKAARKEAKSS
jgi:hypothetical protein